MKQTVLDHLLILFPVGLLASVQLMLKWQALRLGTLESRLAYLRAMALSPWVWLALFFAVAAFLLWLLVLRRYPLGYVYPFVSLTFPLVVAGGALLFGERVSAGQAGALALLVVGVALNARFTHAP
jgi:drug/metabolite transporter (DMT)-like permease